MGILSTLSKFGFDEQKEKTYLTLLSLGEATVGEVAKKSGIDRTTTYRELSELAEQGLIQEIKKKSVTYVAEEPAKLLDFLDREKRKIENIIPVLSKLFKSNTDRPRLRFYEGDEGVKKVFEDPLNFLESVVYSFSSVENIMGRFGAVYTRHYVERRTRNKVKRLSLRPVSDKIKSKKDWEIYSSEKSVMREVRYLPENIDCKTLIQIYNGRVGVIGTKKENYAFILESKELFLLLKQTFELIWSMAKTG